MGAIVETRAKSQVYLQPYTGAVAAVQQNSQVVIEKLAITMAGDVVMQRDIVFNLKKGSITSMIDPAKHNINRYAVRTPKGLSQAQGTSFTDTVGDNDASLMVTADSVSFTTNAGVTYVITAGNVTETPAGGVAQPPVPLSQAAAANPAFATAMQNTMNMVANIVQNNLGNIPTNSAANLMAQVTAVASAARPAQAAAFTSEAITAVTTPGGSATGTRPNAAAAAVIAAVVTVAPSQVTQIVDAGVTAAPGQTDAVAAAAAARTLPAPGRRSHHGRPADLQPE